MSGYTPGEWEVSYRLRSDRKKVAESIIAENGETVCEGFSWNANGENDARLIAAAPDLLDALEMVSSQEDVMMPACVWIKVRDALKKAKGETP